MKSNLIYWVWLSRININIESIRKLLQKYDIKQISKLKQDELLTCVSKEESEKILDLRYRQGLKKYIEYMKKNNIKLISIYDNEYPKKLLNIPNYPLWLYVKGNITILNEFALAIIGCRKSSKYGENTAEKIAYKLSKMNINIISGLARGIDSRAHIGAIRANEKTIAVLGNGIDTIYPKENTGLAKEILKKDGAIISEYIMGTKPNKENFPRRNRIISGISDGIVVIEAQERSGSLITAEYGLEQGKEVFAIPGNINSLNSIGTNRLIQDGAKLVMKTEDIIEEYTNRLKIY